MKWWPALSLTGVTNVVIMSRTVDWPSPSTPFYATRFTATGSASVKLRSNLCHRSGFEGHYKDGGRNNGGRNNGGRPSLLVGLKMVPFPITSRSMQVRNNALKTLAGSTCGNTKKYLAIPTGRSVYQHTVYRIMVNLSFKT